MRVSTSVDKSMGFFFNTLVNENEQNERKIDNGAEDGWTFRNLLNFRFDFCHNQAPGIKIFAASSPV